MAQHMELFLWGDSCTRNMTSDEIANDYELKQEGHCGALQRYKRLYTCSTCKFSAPLHGEGPFEAVHNSLVLKKLQ